MENNYKFRRLAAEAKAAEDAIQNATAEYALRDVYRDAVEARETLTKREVGKRNDALRANEDDRRWMME